MTKKKKFTQRELREAHSQIIKQRNEGYQTALNAAKELEGIVGCGNCRVERVEDFILGYRFEDFHLYNNHNVLIFYVHEDYGPYLSDLTKKLDNHRTARKLRDDELVVHCNDPQYKVKTSFGTYVVAFRHSPG